MVYYKKDTGCVFGDDVLVQGKTLGLAKGSRQHT
jgi:hypothetical protein